MRYSNLTEQQCVKKIQQTQQQMEFAKVDKGLTETDRTSLIDIYDKQLEQLYARRATFISVTDPTIL